MDNCFIMDIYIGVVKSFMVCAIHVIKFNDIHSINSNIISIFIIYNSYIYLW